jgi:hypothetical protein
VPQIVHLHPHSRPWAKHLLEQRVVQALATLVRYAEITDLRDGTYAARRAA